MTTQNWPDPKRPGVPLFLERDGWHLLRVFGGTTIEWWSANAQAFDNHYDPRYAIYDCACLTPTQIDEMLAAERERCISACENEGKAFESPEYAGGKYNAWGELFAVSECIKAIRNLGTAQEGLDDETRS